MPDKKTLIDEKSYRVFKGSDWPDFDDFIKNNYHVEESIETEINDFISIMEKKYEDIATPRSIELSVANQKRQGQIFFNKHYTEKSECRIPWETLGIEKNGNAYICASPSWIPMYVGNILESNSIYDDILNSRTSLKIRQEILAGRYYYCNTRICSFFDFKDTSKYQKQPVTELDVKELEFEDSPGLHVQKIPTNLIFDFDYTCNFKCPSCRTEIHNWNADHILRPINDQLVEKIKHLIIDEIQDQPISIRWCGGEPFMSEVYMELLRYIIASGKKNIQNVIQTNGSLLVAKKDLVQDLLPYISNLRISFDAGCAETYALTRVGGDWNRLIENIKFVVALIKEQQFKTIVSADYVVQKNNYKDLPQFVEVCKELGIQVNITHKMWNWGTWDTETFNEMNAYHPDHALYEDVKKYFKLAKLPMAKN
jgi:MoaA/NifB/PqqE/SkfB family radical SAM enzyme